MVDWNKLLIFVLSKWKLILNVIKEKNFKKCLQDSKVIRNFDKWKESIEVLKKVWKKLAKNLHSSIIMLNFVSTNESPKIVRQVQK